MAVNVGKTAALLTGRQRNIPTQLHLRGQDVEWKSCIRYLSVHIDRSLHMIPQMDNQRRRLQAQQNMVLRMIAETGCYVNNDVIARELRVQTIEDFVRTQAQRLFDSANEDPMPSLYI
ncbi:hypothetical protein EVAR_34228_1 [Eumeta japonica]|uniref:Uncharacterized protein n=1 Tax=Eumeta variegata TaxID=151549 RepID=A0A4C1WZA3_EUMVA|nr:hypothetical protein EVAR_34228_1 [Eumeta japonica]